MTAAESAYAEAKREFDAAFCRAVVSHEGRVAFEAALARLNAAEEALVKEQETR